MEEDDEDSIPPAVPPREAHYEIVSLPYIDGDNEVSLDENGYLLSREEAQQLKAEGAAIYNMAQPQEENKKDTNIPSGKNYSHWFRRFIFVLIASTGELATNAKYGFLIETFV